MGKRFLLVLLAVICSVGAMAQDKIYMRNGDVLQVKIKGVSGVDVTYIRTDNPDGPTYTVSRAQVDRIVYANGTEETPAQHTAHRHISHKSHEDTESRPRINYGPNIIAFAPLQFTENGLGLGLSYERELDKAGFLAFYLPLAATFNLNNGTYYDNATQTYKNRNEDLVFYAMPGIKIYPTGGHRFVKYSLGPSLVIASGQKSSMQYDALGNQYQHIDNELKLGMIFNNSLNINPTAHISVGFDFGFGFTYLNRVGGLNQSGGNGLVEGAFKIGYRF